MSKIEPVLPPLTPELFVSNIEQSKQFYCDVLGFEIAYERSEYKFIAVHLHGAYFMLEQIDEFHAVTEDEFIKERQWRTGELKYPFGRGMNFLINSPDCRVEHQRLLDNGYPIKFPIEERSYRVGSEIVEVRQFLVMDPDGFLIRFDTDLKIKPIK